MNFLNFDDFTEISYEQLLYKTKQQYKFYFFPEYLNIEAGVLWRHDIDFSVHRSYALAKIEHQLNIFTTYFVYLHSEFYNLFEKEIKNLICKIADMGHQIGLHFDPSFYNLTIDQIDKLEHNVKAEKNILSDLIGRDIETISFHNPDIGGAWYQLPMEKIAGMVFTYAPEIQKRFEYCSDSNGYWRYKHLNTVLDEKPKRLQVLTHPIWWTPETLSPKKRILRAVSGRSQNVIACYDQTLFDNNRLNID